MEKGRPIYPEEEARMVRLWQEGKTYEEIGDKVGRSATAARRTIDRVRRRENVTNDVGKSDESKWLVPRDELTELVATIVNEKCLMCDKTDWFNCKLRRIISDLPVDVKNVPNGCWRDAE